MTKELQAIVELIAGQHKLDPMLVMAVVLTESSGDPMAYRYEPAFWARYLADHPDYNQAHPKVVSASYGLMQLMYPTAKQEGFAGKPWELFDPVVNIEYGCRHLRRQLAWADSFDLSTRGQITDTELRSALAAYNGGRRGNEPDANPDRNAAYAAKVMKFYKSLAPVGADGPAIRLT